MGILNCIFNTEADKTEKIENQKSIVVISDSLYSISCICDYYDNWIRDGILNEKSNWEIIQEIHDLCLKNNVAFSHIKSHQNLSTIQQSSDIMKKLTYKHYKNNDYIDKLVQSLTKSNEI